MADSVFCNNCGTPITGESSGDPTQRKPCHVCGSLGRDFRLNASSAVFTLTGGSANFTYTTYPDKLLNVAQELIAKGEFSIAVVVAHMACEISVDRALSNALKTKNLEYIEDSINGLLPGYNIGNNRVRKLFNAITGNQIQIQSFWQPFMESVERRNKAVHKGRIIIKTEADASYEATSKLIEYLKPMW